MFWFVLAQFVTLFVDLAFGTRRGDPDKDLQILALRRQVRSSHASVPARPG